MKNYFEIGGHIVPFKNILYVFKGEDKTNFIIDVFMDNDRLKYEHIISVDNSISQPIIEDYKKWLEVNAMKEVTFEYIITHPEDKSVYVRDKMDKCIRWGKLYLESSGTYDFRIYQRANISQIDVKSFWTKLEDK